MNRSASDRSKQAEEEDEEYSKFVSNSISHKENDCQTCKHRSTVKVDLCLAYPDGIPTPILMGEVSHKKAFKGDHGIRWEAK